MRASPRSLLLLVLLGACGGSQVGTLAAVEPEDQALEVDPRFRIGRLDNGLRYYIAASATPRAQVEMRLVINAGSLVETDEQRGLAHFVEHMVFNGTAEYPGRTAVEYLAAHGGSFGADVNGMTRFDETLYRLTIPSGAEALRGVHILREWAGRATFAPAEIERERGVVLEEARLRDNPHERQSEREIAVLTADSPYENRLPIGDPGVLKKAGRSELVRFYRTWYRPELMTVVVVGDLDVDALEAAVREQFGDLAPAKPPMQRPEVALPTAERSQVVIDSDRERRGTYLSMEVAETFHRQPLAEKMRQMFIWVTLFGIVKERMDETYGPDSVQADLIDATRWSQRLYFHTVLTGGRATDLIGAITVEIARIERHGVSEEELERARARALLENQPTEQPSAELADQVVRYHLIGAPLVSPAAKYALLETVLKSVTVRDFKRMAAEFRRKPKRVFITGPVGFEKPKVERVLAALRPNPEGLQPYVSAPDDPPVFAGSPAPGRVVAQQRIAPDLAEWRLSNGARVLVKNMPTPERRLHVYAHARVPRSLAQASRAMVLLAAHLFEQGAPIGWSRAGLKKALDRKWSTLHLSLGSDSSTVASSAPLEHAALPLELVAAALHQYQFEEAGFKQAMLDAREDARPANPESAFAALFDGALLGSWFAAPLDADWDALRFTGARDFLRQRLANAREFTFFVVGPVDLDSLRPLVERTLGALPAGAARDNAPLSRWEMTRRSKPLVRTNGFANRASLEMAFRGSHRHPDAFGPLALTHYVLARRLEEVLREEMGKTYHVAADGLSDIGQYYVRFQLTCAPEEVQALEKRALAEVEALKSGDIPAAYIEDFRQYARRIYREEQASPEAWNFAVKQQMLTGDPVNTTMERWQRAADQASAALLKKTAREFLRPEQYVSGYLLPADREPSPLATTTR